MNILKKIMMFTFCMVLISSSASAMETKILNFSVSDDTSDVINGYQRFLEMVFGETGYGISIAKEPIKRGIHGVATGTKDGIVLLPAYVAEKSEKIVTVPVPLAKIEVVVYTKGQTFAVNGPESLKPYKIAFLRGYPATEKITTGLDRRMVDSLDSLFAMLQAGRVDAALVLKRESIRFLKANPQFAGFTMLETPLLTVPLHLLLNKKHEALIPRIQPVMKQKIADGTLKELLMPYVVK
ncbi:MAG: transporter substrate-binding domain-containing protein [Thermodesulfobacteriota bacterium]|nr:transporter substrate-binding domain-containing protein [Thermodesulfobacteriota bacterium]